MLVLSGKNSVSEAIKSGQQIKEVWVIDSKNPRLQQIRELCQNNSIPFINKNNQELKEWENENHQGVIAFLEKKSFRFFTLEEFFKTTKVITPTFFVLLDSITDPRNFGAILRSCDHFGITAVITPKNNSVPITPVVSKTSSGAINYVPIIHVINLVRTIEWLKKQDTWIYGMDADSDRLISECDLKGNIGLVIGSEGHGMRRLVRKSCDFLVKIQNLGHVDSLNVSVASGIAMYEVLRQRNDL